MVFSPYFTTVAVAPSPFIVIRLHQGMELDYSLIFIMQFLKLLQRKPTF